jgi:hypothetical protein
MLAVAVVSASAALILTGGGDASLPPELTIVGVLAAFVMALCFRQLGLIPKDGKRGKRDRLLLTAALAMAAATLLVNARIIAGVAPHMFSRTLRQLTGHGN